MANSIAYVLSLNTYPDAFQANLIGAKQGTQIVYATTDTLSSSNILYTDSRLTQPFYGDPTAWYGVQLLDDDAVKYALLIGANGAITTNPGTTTTTAGPTTTTTAAPTTTTTTAAPTTTTTTQAVVLYNADYLFGGSGVPCNGTGQFNLPLVFPSGFCANDSISLASGYVWADFGLEAGVSLKVKDPNNNQTATISIQGTTGGYNNGCTSC